MTQNSFGSCKVMEIARHVSSEDSSISSFATSSEYWELDGNSSWKGDL